MIFNSLNFSELKIKKYMPNNYQPYLLTIEDYIKLKMEKQQSMREYYIFIEQLLD